MFVYNYHVLQYFTKLFYVLKAFNFQLNVNKKNNQNQIHDINCFFLRRARDQLFYQPFHKPCKLQYAKTASIFSSLFILNVTIGSVL